ncbi:DUF6890 family protein [Endozoicomonas montiporae]|uniref:DUF6890 family protein n=1 Tax=Endozoicomonas montiporae TaxID=1027273 RepID=UPI0039B774DB
MQAESGLCSKKIEKQARAIKDNGLEQLVCYALKWFPHHEPTDEILARARFLETDYWERVTVSQANGTAKAFSGKR